ncbi:spermatogenesis-associated protein 1 [Engystomops pustulosus]|uniref:spermatogenesis-associated protein 1 n=1 Tax=Engystomops pustulosus TaxID=76066 RepID=UPI003AFB0C5E
MDSDKVQTPMTETRPSTAGLIELHVYLVPEDLWNPGLNKVSIDVISRFISLGFIRVPTDMKLRALRDSLVEFLGEYAITDKFVFLKSVGSSLAVVKSRQEYDLKMKAFAPPYAREPELYLLPGINNEGSIYSTITSSTITTDEASEPSEVRGDTVPETTIQPITVDIATNATVSQPVQDEGRSFIWNKKRQNIVPVTSHIQDQDQMRHSSIFPPVNGNLSDVPSRKSQVISPEDGKKISGRNPTGDSGIADSLHGVEAAPSPRKRKEKPVRETPTNRESRGQIRDVTKPNHYQPPPPPPLLPDLPTIISPRPHIALHDETILEQLNIVKEERIQLEKSREELIKRIKFLLEQHKLRRQQARDSWKKKYFETKKETSLLEERLNKLKNEMDAYYQRLLKQLAARDSKKHAKHPTLAANSKNSLIMKITTKQQEFDQLKHKLDNARIKLVIEIKMRKQASSDLNVLKAELAQKKAQAGLSHPPPLFAV